MRTRTALCAADRSFVDFSRAQVLSPTPPGAGLMPVSHISPRSTHLVPRPSSGWKPPLPPGAVAVGQGGGVVIAPALSLREARE